MSWWEFYPDHLIELLELDGMDDAAADGQLIEVTDESVLQESQQCQVECAQMRVLVEGQPGTGKKHCEFGWGAYPKDGDVWVTTPTFTLDRLMELLEKASAAESPADAPA